MATAPSSVSYTAGPAGSLVRDGTQREAQWRAGLGSSLTACSQGQASSAASNEVVQGVVGLLSDLGTDAGGNAKYGTNGSCGADRRGWALSQGPVGAGLPGQCQRGHRGEVRSPPPQHTPFAHLQ